MDVERFYPLNGDHTEDKLRQAPYCRDKQLLVVSAAGNKSQRWNSTIAIIL